MNDDVAKVNGSLSERYQALSSTRKSLGYEAKYYHWCVSASLVTLDCSDV